MLRLNGYQEQIINQTKLARTNQHTTEREENDVTDESKDGLFFSIPYISDALGNELRRIVRQTGSTCASLTNYTPSDTMHHLKLKPKAKTCEVKKCPIQSDICFLRGVMYKVT